MRCAPRVVTTALVFSLAVSSVAAAQERSGFWGGFGGGWGLAKVSADEFEDGDREGSGVGYFNLGWTLSNRVLVGGEFNIWSKTAEVEPGVDVTADIYNFSGTLTFYPQPLTGFFLKGGAGASFVDADVDIRGSNITVDLGSGFGFIVGAGYDVRLGRILSLTPAVNFWYGQPGDLQIAGSPAFTDWKHNVIDFTVGLKFH